MVVFPFSCAVTYTIGADFAEKVDDRNSSSSSSVSVNTVLLLAVAGVAAASFVLYFLSRFFEKHRKGSIKKQLEDLESASCLRNAVL